MKKFILLLTGILTFITISGCSRMHLTDEDVLNEEPTIVTTVFPAYDFARAIAGNRANVILLVPPGTEIHDYSPSPGDMKQILHSSLFIYNGGESDAWVEELINSSDSRVNQLRMMDCVDLITEQITEEMFSHETNEQEPDEHVWTSPRNAATICNAICNELTKLDPENEKVYQKNSAAYTQKLTQLDIQFQDIVDTSPKNLLVFADRFPARYFTDEYGLQYAAIYPGCSEESEASARTNARIVEIVRENNISCVLFIEMSNRKIADIICEETGCESAEFNCCHNISKDDFESGKTYIDLMTENLDTVRKALS